MWNENIFCPIEDELITKGSMIGKRCKLIKPMKNRKSWTSAVKPDWAVVHGYYGLMLYKNNKVGI